MNAAIQTATSCAEMMNLFGSYRDGRLSVDRNVEITCHLAKCPDCNAAFRAYTRARGGVGELQSGRAPQPEALQCGLAARLGSAPWWFVSLSLHVLVIILA